jgi:hypothetical protein
MAKYPGIQFEPPLETRNQTNELLERTRGLVLAIAKLESTLAQLQLTLVAERNGKSLPPHLLNVN